MRLLGRFELLVGDRRRSLPLASQRLLALLSVRHRPMSRVAVAATLWPDHDPEHAAGNLRTALWRIRAVAPDAVDVAGGSVAIGEPMWVDLHAAELLAHRIAGGLATPEEGVEEIGLFVHDLLPDADDEWLSFERERFREIRVRALEHVCELASESGRYGEAVEAGLLAIDAEPLRESSHRALMRAFIAEGNGALAIQQGRVLEAALMHELGVGPSYATLELERVASEQLAPPLGERRPSGEHRR